MNVSIVLKLLDGVTGPIRRVGQAVASASRAMEGARAKADKSFQSAANIKHAADGMGEFARKAREGILSAVDASESFDEAMARVRAVTGASNGEFEQLNSLASKLGSTGRFGANEVAKGMEQLRGEGLSVAEIMGTLPRLMDAAVVSNTSLDTVIGQSTGMLDAFSLKAGDMGRALDASQAAALAAGTPVNSMREALSVAGVAAAQAGISFERTAVLAGLLAQRNIEGSQAGTTLEKTLKVLKNPSKDAAGFFGKMGVSLTESVSGVKQMRDPLKVLTELQQSMTKHGVSATDQLSNMTELFERAAPDIQAMLEAARAGGLEELNAAMANSTGKVGALANAMRKNGAESTRDLGGAFAELQRTMGAVLSPLTEPFKRGMEDVVRSITGWIRENPKLAQSVGLVAVAIAAGATAIAGLISVLGTLVATKGLLTMAFGAGKVALALGGIALPAIAVAAAIGAVTLAVVQLARAWDTLDFGETWKGIKDAFGDGSVWKTLSLNPFEGLLPGVDGAALAPPSTAQSPDGSLGAASAPKGLIEVQISSEGRPSLKNPPKASGIDLDVSSGMVMSN